MKNLILKSIFFSILFLSFFSCKKEIQNDKIVVEIVKPDKYIDLYGNWVGDFIADSIQDIDGFYVDINKINIVLKKIEDNKVYGHSVVAGNYRPFIGTLSDLNNKLNFKLKEPGDDKYDGVFQFEITENEIIGEWVANDKKAKVLKRNFKLKKQNFTYNPNLQLPDDRDYVDYYSHRIDSAKEVIDNVEETYYDEYYRTASNVITKLNASTTKLTEKELKNLKKLELEIIRNTIFARHGYTFKKKSFRQFFDPVEWYVPVSNDVSKDLTDLEKENINLLDRFEKYAEDNYDSFGR